MMKPVEIVRISATACASWGWSSFFRSSQRIRVGRNPWFWSVSAPATASPPALPPLAPWRRSLPVSHPNSTKKNFWCDVGADPASDPTLVGEGERLLQLLRNEI